MTFINTLITKYADNPKALETYKKRTEKSIRLTEEALAKSEDEKYIEGYEKHLVKLRSHLDQFTKALDK